MENDHNIGERLAIIEEKLRELVDTNRTRGEDHERRLRAVEKWMYAIPPTLLTSVSAMAITIWQWHR